MTNSTQTTRAHQPLFTQGQTVTVAAAHERAYPRRARGGALGVITDVGRLVGGVRRYSVRFEAYWGAPNSSALPLRIPEEHLRAVAAPRPAVAPDAESTRNAARLAEVNSWMHVLDLTTWNVHEVASISGYIIGVYMTYKPTGYTICATTGDEIRRVEGEQSA